jgi:hypothetical protein
MMKTGSPGLSPGDDERKKLSAVVFEDVEPAV